MMKTALILVSTTLCVLAACSKSTEPKEPAQNSSLTGNPLTAPVDYIGAIGKAQKSAIRTIDLASLKQNIQLFYGAEGRFPKDLKELVSMGYIAKLPEPPQGSQFGYNAADGQIRLIKLPPAPTPQ